MYALRVFSVYAAICSVIIGLHLIIGYILTCVFLIPMFYWVSKDVERMEDEKYKAKINRQVGNILKRLQQRQKEYYGGRDVQAIN